jgi:CheY-like chemotaxis protein
MGNSAVTGGDSEAAPLISVEVGRVEFEGVAVGPEVMPVPSRMVHEQSKMKQDLPEMKQDLPMIKQDPPEMKQDLPKMEQAFSEMKQAPPEIKQDLPKMNQDLPETKQDLSEIKQAPQECLETTTDTRQAPPEFPGTTTTAGPLQLPGTLRILVVDDDNINRKLLVHALLKMLRKKIKARKLAGCKRVVVNACEDGSLAVQEATPKGEEVGYHAITMDAQMPVMGGFQATRILRENGFTNAIFGCTGNSLDTDQRAFLESGVDKVFVKPIQISSLVESIIDHIQTQTHLPTENSEAMV